MIILTLRDIPLGGKHATVTRWLVEMGTAVEIGQLVAVLLGERAEFAVVAEQAGTLVSLAVNEEATAELGGVLATFEKVTATPPTRISPLARRIARDHSIAWSELTGTGFRGRILKRDVLGAMDDRRPEPALSQSEGTDDRLNSRDAGTQEDRKIAKQDANQTHPSSFILHPSFATALPLQRFTAPMVLTVMEADFGAVQAACTRSGVGRIVVDETACVALVVAEALREHPQLRTQWHGDGFMLRRRVTLMVEQHGAQRIVDDAQDLNMRGIARALANDANAKTPTFRIRVSLASEWSQAATPTLVVGVVTKRPSVVGTGQDEHVAIRPVARLALHYDARVATQHEADCFLRAVVRGIEQFDAL